MKEEMIKRLIDLEWILFQNTNNEGGRADCQDDHETFYLMRTAQAKSWSEEMVRSWLQDVVAAVGEGRNPVAEKYARMMAYTAPDAYEDLRELLPDVEPEAEAAAQELTRQIVIWAEEAAAKYPHLVSRSRPIHASEDTPAYTSLETYHLGELLTYSAETLELFWDYYEQKQARGENLYLDVLEQTVRLLGYDSLDDAEASADTSKLF
ncbi:MAG: DUF4125 family protein [Lachnospiraceae bacterium]|nr:DUF4125 family protein [Lachnospiraceae bacterium]